MRLTFLTLCALWGTSVFAADQYGVVNMQQIILTVSEGKAARAELEKEIKAKETELLKQKKELDAMNEDWKKQAPLLSEEARISKQKTFQEKFLALRQQEMGFQAQIKRKEQLATQKLAVKIAKVVETIAKQKKLKAVFELNSAGLLYLEKPVDLTKDVVTVYEKQHKTK
jgi:outer membrane protein